MPDAGGESAKYLTYNVANSKTYNKDEPKLITMEASKKLYLEKADQLKLLQFQESSKEEAKDDPSHPEKPQGKIVCQDLSEID